MKVKNISQFFLALLKLAIIKNLCFSFTEFINSPSHLTDLSIALHKYFTSSEDKNRFLHLDSLSTLNIHNEAGSVLKFVHYLTGKMRVFGLKGVILSLREETDKKLIAELSQFCDKMIKL